MSQDGEKEIVLGNKQLISLFFVVVALCGVFFAMGYMIGHNTSKAVVAGLGGVSNSDGANSGDSSSPAAAPASSPEASDVASAQQPQDSQPAAGGSEPPRETAPTETHPAQDTPATDAPSAPVPEPKPAEPKSVKSAVAVPQPGATYLQVTALRRTDADSLVKTLREQNFPALIAESSKPELFRVLVGPYRQTVDVADAKARLKALGFGNAFVYK